MTPGNQANSDSDLESVISFKEVPKLRRNSSGPKYVCSIEGCSQSFKRLDKLDQHEFHHTGIKKHYCIYDGCDKVYSILTHLKRHLRTTHERVAPAEKNVPCQIPGCLKMFQTETNMRRHIREVHENPKIYSCKFCAEKFTQKLKLRRHEIQKHTGDYPYTCEKCARGFYQQWQHDRHISCCKVYICANCEMQFNKWTQYVKHCKVKQHGRKFYQCENCERVYGRPSELQKHIAAKHMDSEKKMIFKCQTCERSYAYERNLRQHMRVAHDGKHFECTEDGCERVFSSGQNLAKHLEREHKRPAIEGTNVIQQKKNKPKVARKKRKDAGRSIISNLSRFSGVVVDKNLDKLLREREDDALDMAGKMLVEQHSESDDSEDDLPLAKFARKQQPEITKPIENGLETLMSAILTDA
ncbi:transcription factor IIIA [Anastrepha obliqua]|uniref:transcription factor IIIA n=1 Tax=Anastrepha obliqua TaxID=95512 RepID=UPI0024096C79|nr:transcription factor IIIA [Anastrepha obliqua]